MQFITEHWAVIASALLGVSEVLALIPSVKANGIFHSIYIALGGK